MKWYVRLIPDSNMGDVVCLNGTDTFYLHFRLEENGDVNYISAPDRMRFNWQRGADDDDAILPDSDRVPASIRKYMETFTP